jgi:hypothetical protein
MMTGSMNSTDAAIVRFQSVWNWLRNSDRPIESVYRSGFSTR